MIWDRITEIADFKGVSRRKFCESIGVSSSFLSHRTSDIGVSKLLKILEIYPDINPVWLLTGAGEMLNAYTGKQKNIDNKDIIAVSEWELFGRELKKEAFRELSHELATLSSLMTIIQENLNGDVAEYAFRELQRKQDPNSPLSTTEKNFIKKYKDCYLEVSDYVKKIKEEINKSPDLIKEPDEKRER